MSWVFNRSIDSEDAGLGIGDAPTSVGIPRTGIRPRVLIPLAVVLIVLQLLVFLQAQRAHTEFLQTDALRPAEEVAERINDYKSVKSKAMLALASQLTQDGGLERAVVERRYEDLLLELSPTYDELADALGITHLYVHTPDGTNYIRVHNPPKSGGPIDRWTLRQTMETGRPHVGFESGKFGTLTLRSVSPWVRDGQTLAYLELGVELDHIINELDVPILAAVPKSSLDEGEYRETLGRMGREDTWDAYPGHVVPYCNSAQLLAFLEPSLLETEIAAPAGPWMAGAGPVLDGAETATSTEILTDGDRSWLISGLNFADSEGAPVTTLYTMRDVTSLMAHSSKAIYRDTAILGAVSVVLLAGGFFLLGGIDRTLERKSRGLVDAKTLAEGASQAKTDFLANMSHEIRTPMTAILGYADLIGGDFRDDPEQVTEAIRAIQSNTTHLLTVINDILDVSKIEAGQLKLEQIDVCPVVVVKEVVDLVRPRATGKGLDVRLRCRTPIPATITSDPTRLRQILLNLTGNAIKFTEIGGVTIDLELDADAGLLRFHVTDSGIGMSPEQLETISRFEAFSQADTSTTRKYGGTGLGLRISNALAAMLGGDISVRSAEGRGSEFTLTIGAEPGSTGQVLITPDEVDLNDSAPPPVSPEADPAWKRGNPLSGVRILLAEDGPDNQRLITLYLKRAGAEVSVAENGLIAVDAIAAAREPEWPHIVLMDMQMPELDGYGATRRLRSSGFMRPIIAVTAHAMDGDWKECLEAGCDAYLSKPVNRYDLIAMCARYVRRVTDEATAA